ncbi:hypothetical protein BHM03_00061373, partial [Ensete ventricosum]
FYFDFCTHVMLSMRFSNSGIRAKVFVRKIGFKLLVMILNRIESFYAFLLRFRSEGSKEEGRPATASPMQDRPWPRPPATRGDRLRLGPTRKGDQWVPMPT